MFWGKLWPYRDGVRRAFRETLLPGHPRHSALRKNLEKAEKHKWEAVYAPQGEDYPTPAVCEGCGYRWRNEKARRASLAKGRHNCWAKREHLCAPHKAGHPPDAPATGMLFKTKLRGKKVTGIVTNGDEAYNISTATPRRLRPKFWQNKSLTYTEEASNKPPSITSRN